MIKALPFLFLLAACAPMSGTYMENLTPEQRAQLFERTSTVELCNRYNSPNTRPETKQDIQREIEARGFRGCPQDRR